MHTMFVCLLYVAGASTFHEFDSFCCTQTTNILAFVHISRVGLSQAGCCGYGGLPLFLLLVSLFLKEVNGMCHVQRSVICLVNILRLETAVCHTKSYIDYMQAKLVVKLVVIVWWKGVNGVSTAICH